MSFLLTDYPEEMREEIYSHMDTLTLYRLNQVRPTPFTRQLYQQRVEEETNLEVLFYVNYVPGLIRWVKAHIDYVFELFPVPGKRFKSRKIGRTTEQPHDVTACLIAWARYDLNSLIEYLSEIAEDDEKNDYNYWMFRLYIPLFHQRHYSPLVALMEVENLIDYANEFLSSEGEEVNGRELARFFTLLPSVVVRNLFKYNDWHEWSEVYNFLIEHPDEENISRYQELLL